MRGSYDDMMDWKYREENPGYEREIGLTASELGDCDPDLAVEVAAVYARDNAGRVRRNHQAKVAGLMALLEENGIEIPDDL